MEYVPNSLFTCVSKVKSDRLKSVKRPLCLIPQCHKNSIQCDPPASRQHTCGERQLNRLQEPSCPMSKTPGEGKSGRTDSWLKRSKECPLGSSTTLRRA